MPDPERTTAAESGVNLLLPEGLSPSDAQSLGERLVAALTADPATSRGLARGTLAFSGEGEGAVPEGVPTLNRFIGVLTVPLEPGSSVDAVRNAIRRVPGADGVQVAPLERFGVPPGEDPG